MGYYNLISLMSPKGPSFDPDAQLFITNAAITDTTQQNAVNNLVINLKNYGIWSKMKALYPFVGGTASQHKFNLRNPLDTDAAFRLVFNGGWTHSSTGALPNGTNAWANTWFKSGINFTSKDNAHYSFYSRTDLASAGIEIGADESPSNHALYTKSTSNTAIFLLNGGTYPNVAVANSLGFYQANRNAVNTINAWKNGSKLNEMASTSAVATGAFMAISAYNNATNTPSYYSAKQAAFSSFGDGLTDTEAANYYTAVQTFQTTLGRHVGVPIVADSDAQAFLNAAVIEDVTQANAVNTLVTDLKGYGIWSKMKAIYPFVGGTASQHKFNLKNPLDTDAAYRLVFNGGWTHSSTGALPNGTNAYADTFLIPNNVQSLNSNSIGAYSGNISNSTERILMGSYGTGISILFNTSTFLGTRLNSAIVSSAITGDSGLLMSSRTDATTTKIYKNSTNLSTGNSGGTALSEYKILLGTMSFSSNNPYGSYSINQFRLAFMADGFNSTEQANLYTAVQTFQTTLSRNV